MRILLIRHGKTQGNLEGRYVGRTDEPLCAAGRAELARQTYPPAEAVFVSPLLRCRQSAEQIYPGLPLTGIPGFRECDFGEFEMKNYAELNGNPAYQAWIDSGGELPFPGGESRAQFQDRCCAAFLPVAEDLLARAENGFGAPPATSPAPDRPFASRQISTAAFVVHGGTIMALLAAFAEPRRGYFDWQVKNGAGYSGILERAGDGHIRIRALASIGSGMPG